MNQRTAYREAVMALFPYQFDQALSSIIANIIEEFRQHGTAPWNCTRSIFNALVTSTPKKEPQEE